MEGSPKTRTVKQLAAVRTNLRKVLQWAKKRQPGQTIQLGTVPKTVVECWQSAMKRISKLGGLVPGGAIHVQGACPERVPPAGLLQHLVV